IFESLVLDRDAPDASFAINGGALNADGAVVISSGPIIGDSVLRFTGAGNQLFTSSLAVSGLDLPVEILKPSGRVDLASDLTLDNPGADLTITSGTFNVAGHALSVNDQLVIGSSGTLQMWGSESIAYGTKVLNSSSMVIFTGDNDAAISTYTLTAFSTWYENL